MSKSKAAAVPREQEWLNGAERDRLRMLEVAIDAGARAFIVMGTALAEIRDSRLYREAYDTFEAYCKAKWGISRSRAYEYMDAAGVADRLSGIPDTPAIESASVARELSPLRDDPPAMAAALTTAVEQHGPEPTAAQVREVVRGPEPDALDIRFAWIEDAAGRFKDLPSPGRMVWPAEQGDIEAIDEAFRVLSELVPAYKASWRDHKRQMRGLSGLASVRGC